MGAVARPCLIRSQVKLCGSWPVTPCTFTIVHNAISISSTPKFNSTLNKFKSFHCKYLSFSSQRQTDRDLITQNSLITSDRSRLFYLETFKTFIQDVFINCCPLQVLSVSTFHQNSCKSLLSGWHLEFLRGERRKKLDAVASTVRYEVMKLCTESV